MIPTAIGYGCCTYKADRIFMLNNEVNEMAWISARKFNSNTLQT